MADLVVLRGRINAGKTTTCGLIYQNLLGISEISHLFDSRTVSADSLRFTSNNSVIDFEAVLTLSGGRSVSIISAGDNMELRDKLRRHISRSPHTIICCTRSVNRRGSTFRMLRDEFERDHPIVLEQRVVRTAERNLAAAKAPIVNAVVNYITSVNV